MLDFAIFSTFASIVNRSRAPWKLAFKAGFHWAHEWFAKDANVEKIAKSNIRRSFSPNVSRQWSRKPFLRSLCVVLITYVRMSCVALPNYGQSTYTKNTQLKYEQHECRTNLGQHSCGHFGTHANFLRVFLPIMNVVRHSYICRTIILRAAIRPILGQYINALKCIEMHCQ